MGLDDIITDHGGSVDSTSSTDEEEDDTVEVGSGEYKKVFTEEKWEKVRKVITEEMGRNLNHVRNNLPAKEKYSIFHKAATWGSLSESDKDEEKSDTRCVICGKACNHNHVVIAGETVCTHHTTAQLANELN